MSDEQYVTRSGKVLTEADIQALADEAEEGYDVNSIHERFVVIRAADFRRMTEPRAMNMATAQAHRDEWVQLVAGEITQLRENLIMRQAADQMYVWADREMATVWMDCPDLNCTEPIALGATPTLAYMQEVAHDHIRTVHWGEPIVLVIEPEGPVHDSERGGSVVDDPAS